MASHIVHSRLTSPIRIKQYSFLEMITLWIPPANIWKQEIDPRTHWLQINQGSHATQLWTSTSEMIERDMRVAQKHFDKGTRHCLTRHTDTCLIRK